MEYDGKKIVQSIAMARFVAKENGLAGKNNMESAMADMLVDCMSDLGNSKYLLRLMITTIETYKKTYLLDSQMHILCRIWTHLQGEG